MFIISEETVSQNNQTASTVSQTPMFIISERTVSQNNQTASMVSQTPMFIISEGTVSQNNRRQLPLHLKLLCLLFQKEQSIRTIRDSFHCISNFYVYYFRQNSQSEQSDSFHCISNFYVYYFRRNSQSEQSETASTVSQTSMFIITDRTVSQNNQRQLPRYLKLLCLLFQNFRRNNQSEQSDSFHGISNSYVYYFRRNSQSEQSETASTVSQTPMFIISDGTVNQNNQRHLPLYLKLLCLLFQKEQSVRTIRDSFHDISNSYVYYFRRNSQSEQSDTASTVSQTSYDPSNPNFRGLDSEIPDFVLIDTTGSSDGANSIKSKSSSTKGNFKSFFDESKRWTILLNHVLSQRNKNYDVLSQLNMMFSPN